MMITNSKGIRQRREEGSLLSVLFTGYRFSSVQNQRVAGIAAVEAFHEVVGQELHLPGVITAFAGKAKQDTMPSLLHICGSGPGIHEWPA